MPQNLPKGLEIYVILQAFKSAGEMESSEQQYQSKIVRQGERNSRVFHKAKLIQASSQLNPNSGKIFSLSGHPAPNLNFGQINFLIQFRFGAQEDLTPNLDSSKNCFGEKA